MHKKSTHGDFRAKLVGYLAGNLVTKFKLLEPTEGKLALTSEVPWKYWGWPEGNGRGWRRRRWSRNSADNNARYKLLQLIFYLRMQRKQPYAKIVNFCGAAFIKK